MTAQQIITEHLDLWTSAHKTRSTAGRGSNNKLDLYGIKKLRELILELAVRGKLVPQDSNDEPASELLKKIADEKEKLIKEGKIKKDRPLPEITDEEKPFELPERWELARLGDIINVLNGRAYKKDEMLSEGTPLLRVGNLFTSNEWYYSNLKLEPDKYIDDGDLIYAWSASFGPFIWEGGKVIYHYHIWKMDLFSQENVDKYYLKNYLQAISAAIKASGNGIAMMHMTKERMEKLALPIPPLAEQHRIVAKVDELMAFCDQLEQTQSDNIATHAQLVEALLATLTNSGNHNELQTNWQRIAANFDTLFTTEHSIHQLKQTILQLAVMGKLVPQNPSDEPASELLKKIAAENAQLIKEGKIKKEKPLSEITDEEKPFELPSGWEWVRIDNICEVQGGIQKQPMRAPKNNHFPYLRVANVQRGHIDTNEMERFELFDGELEKRTLNKGDILIVEGNGSADEIGRCAIWAGQIENCVFQNHLIRVRSLHSGNEVFISKFLNSPSGIAEMKRLAVTTSGLYNLSVGKIRTITIPLPPTSEQHRIVAKVDELMALCDKLKTNLQNAQTTQLALADALVEQAVG